MQKIPSLLWIVIKKKKKSIGDGNKWGSKWENMACQKNSMLKSNSVIRSTDEKIEC